MDKIDLVMASGGVESPQFADLSITERRILHYRLEQAAGRLVRNGQPRGGLLDPAITEARRRQEEARMARSHAIGQRWERDANR